jgi:hypothetical protein
MINKRKLNLIYTSNDFENKVSDDSKFIQMMCALKLLQLIVRIIQCNNKQIAIDNIVYY